MSTELAPAPALPAADTLERLAIQGDLSKLTPQERVRYYSEVCRSLGLNPLTRPFEYITLPGRGLTLYATRNATDQLRRLYRVTVEIVSRERQDDVYVVTARASTPDGRRDEEIGAVSVVGLKGEPLANALMKGSTKAKRRVTLALVGLGWLDETEVETVPGARIIPADVAESEATPELPVVELAPPRQQLTRRDLLDKIDELQRDADRAGVVYQRVDERAPMAELASYAARLKADVAANPAPTNGKAAAR